MFLKVCLNNLLISIFGFGSGAVFLTYANSLYVKRGLINVESFNLFISITESLPGATSIKILSLINYELLGFLLTIITISIFVIPTMLIINYSNIIINLDKSKKYLKLLGQLFTPVLAALILYLTINLLNSITNNVLDLAIVLLLTFITYISKELLKINNYLVLIIINTVFYFIIIKIL